MDADDLSLRNRLGLQASVLDRDPRVVLVTGSVEIIDQNGVHLATDYRPIKNRDFRRLMWLGNPLYHGSVMYRRQTVLNAGGYREDVGPIEDFDLWLRIAEFGEIISVPAAIFRYRVNPASISANNGSLQAQLIGEKVRERWERSQPCIVSSIELRRWIGEIAGLGTEQFRRGVRTRLLRDNSELGVMFLHKGRLLTGCCQILSVLLSCRQGTALILGRTLGFLVRTMRRITSEALHLRS